MQRAQRIRGASGLRLHAIRLLRPEKDIAGAVDQNADAELVDRRHLDGACLGHLDAGESAGRSRQRETGGNLQRVSSIDIGHEILRRLKANLNHMQRASDGISCFRIPSRSDIVSTKTAPNASRVAAKICRWAPLYGNALPHRLRQDRVAVDQTPKTLL